MITMAIDSKMTMMRAHTTLLERREKIGMQQLTMPIEGSLPWPKTAVKIPLMKSSRKMVLKFY